MAALIKAVQVSGETVLAAGNVTLGAAPEKKPATSAVTSAPATKPGAAGMPPTPTTKAAVAPAPAVAPQPAPESEAAMRARLEKRHQDVLGELEDKARDEGYQDGYAAGEAAGRAHFEEAATALETLTAQINDSVAAVLTDAEEIIGAVVFEAVCKILGDRLVSAEGTRAVVAKVLSRVAHEEVVSVRVAPGDLAKLAERTEQDLRLPEFPFEADTNVELGGCLVQLKGGHLDGRIETQFRAFAQSLKEAAHRHD